MEISDSLEISNRAPPLCFFKHIPILPTPFWWEKSEPPPFWESLKTQAPLSHIPTMYDLPFRDFNCQMLTRKFVCKAFHGKNINRN